MWIGGKMGDIPVCADQTMLRENLRATLVWAIEQATEIDRRLFHVFS
jgi:hypothetical protein